MKKPVERFAVLRPCKPQRKVDLQSDSVLIKRVQPKRRFPANASLESLQPGLRTSPRLEYLCESLRDPAQFELYETRFDWTIKFKLPPMLVAPHSRWMAYHF